MLFKEKICCHKINAYWTSSSDGLAPVTNFGIQPTGRYHSVSPSTSLEDYVCIVYQMLSVVVVVSCEVVVVDH